MINANLQYLVESMAMEDLCKQSFTKNAQMSSVISSIYETIKGYIMKSFDPERPVESIMALAAPSVLRSIGLGPIGWLFWIAETFFNVDFKPIFSDILAPIKSILSSAKTANPIQMTMEQAQGYVEPVVSNFVETMKSGASATKESIEEKLKTVSLPKTSLNNENLLHNVKDIKIILSQLESHGLFEKNARYGKLGIAAGLLYAAKDKLFPVIGSALSWILKTVLVSLGFVVAGGAVKDMLGVAKDTLGIGDSKPQSWFPSTTTVPSGLQEDRSLGKEYYGTHNDLWIESFSTTNLANTLADWAIKIYPALKDSKAIILSSPVFHNILSEIEDANNENQMPNSTVMPPNFKSRKQVVDSFVSDVANKLKKSQ